MTHPLLAGWLASSKPVVRFPKVDYYDPSCSRDLDKRCVTVFGIENVRHFPTLLCITQRLRRWGGGGGEAVENARPCYVFLTETRRTDVTSHGNVANLYVCVCGMSNVAHEQPV